MKLASTLHAQVAVRAAVRLQPRRLAILLAATALLALSLLSLFSPITLPSRSSSGPPVLR